MCIETGVGGGSLWEYGKNIFSNRSDAEAGVVKMHQLYHAERAKTLAYQADQAAQQRAQELRDLARLKAKYSDIISDGGLDPRDRPTALLPSVQG